MKAIFLLLITFVYLSAAGQKVVKVYYDVTSVASFLE